MENDQNLGFRYKQEIVKSFIRSCQELYPSDKVKFEMNLTN